MSQAHGVSSLAFRLKRGGSPLDEEMEDAAAAGAGSSQQSSSAPAASAQAPSASGVGFGGRGQGKKRMRLEEELEELEVSFPSVEGQLQHPVGPERRDFEGLRHPESLVGRGTSEMRLNFSIPNFTKSAQDEAAQEADFAEDTVSFHTSASFCSIPLTISQKKKSEAYLQKPKGISGKERESATIAENWTAGWLEHIDSSIRPSDLSRSLVHHVAVLSFFMSLSDARDALVEQIKGSARPFGPADVRKVAKTWLGREWSDLKGEASRAFAERAKKKENGVERE